MVLIIRYVVLATIIAMLVGCAGSARKQVVAVGQSDRTSSMPATHYRASNTPQVVLNFIDKAEQAISNEQFSLALKTLGQAQRLAPNEASIYLVWGDLFTQQGQDVQAVQMYKRAMSLSEAGSRVRRLARNKLSTIAPTISN